MTPRLLVSVRDAAEAVDALAGGADLIDVKEPTRGPMGRADGAVMAAVVAAVGGRVPVSAALGELSIGPIPPGLAFVKWGFAGWAGRDWPGAWAAAVSHLQGGTRPVAVAYADWLKVAAPSPGDVNRHAAGAAVLLIDTAVKDGSTLTDHLGIVSLGRLIVAARAANRAVALAGSLTAEAIARLRPLAPDWFAVRGAACEGGRTGRARAERVRGLKAGAGFAEPSAGGPSG